ncbi:MAG: GNAT family N-acetyltransferase [Candidatus Aminicenantes bacterium]|nr:MAG: GNAT family N-acetyltransferase [Candidatus Aminicenantes bacterium]
MDVKFFPKISGDLAVSVEQFIAQNFYVEGERIPKLLAEEEEKFYSQPKVWLLVFENDQIIGTTALHQRKIQFDNTDIFMGGVGRVCTRMDKRRQGIARQMLKEAMKILREWGCDMAFLCANVKESGDLYAQVGFVPLNKPYTYSGRSGKLYEEINGMIAPLNSFKIFEDVLHSTEKLHLGSGNW